MRLYYGSEEDFFDAETRRTVLLTKANKLDVEVVVVPGDPMTSVPGALKKAKIPFLSKPGTESVRGGVEEQQSQE